MKRTISRVLCGVMIFLIIALSFAGCAPFAAEETTLSFTAMDTVMSLRIRGDSEACERVRDAAVEMDGDLSAVDEDSMIYALNRKGSAELSEAVAGTVRRALELCAETDGFFDITVYPAVEEWGFTTGEYTVPEDDRLRELAAKIDYTAVKADGDRFELPDGVMIDLGAAAKGMLADRAKGILDDCKAKEAVLNLGGTILLYGKKSDGSAFKVGIADPEAPAGYFGYLILDGGIISTSGGYERYFERDGKRYIHILDPATARPADSGAESVTVVCQEGAKADALSTALFVMGADGAAEYYRAHSGFEYVLLKENGELCISEGLADSFTMSDGYDCKIQTVKR